MPQPLKNFDNFPDALAMLQWQVDLGADMCVEERPQRIEALAASSTPARPIEREATPTAAAPAPKLSAPSLTAAIEEARALADAATTLQELEAAVRGFTGCGLKKTDRKSVV